ncbi:MAG: hypothetical protein ACFFCS_05695 [Candidatus Hodarchaeota archaeon]
MTREDVETPSKMIDHVFLGFVNPVRAMKNIHENKWSRSAVIAAMLVIYAEFWVFYGSISYFWQGSFSLEVLLVFPALTMPWYILPYVIQPEVRSRRIVAITIPLCLPILISIVWNILTRIGIGGYDYQNDVMQYLWVFIGLFAAFWIFFFRIYEGARISKKYPKKKVRIRLYLIWDVVFAVGIIFLLDRTIGIIML